jgi:hypothetical protein
MQGKIKSQSDKPAEVRCLPAGAGSLPRLLSIHAKSKPATAGASKRDALAAKVIASVERRRISLGR